MVVESEEVALVSKRAAFLLQGTKRREVPLCEGVVIACGRDADEVIEGAADGATDGATKGVLGGLCNKVGG